MPLTNSQVTAIEPINAWLLISDDESEPSRLQLALRKMRRSAAGVWTGPSQARPGDLLFFYFVAPHKQIRYVARVSGEPFQSSEIVVSSSKTISPHQWWVEHTPLVPVPGVSFAELSAMHGGYLNLRGRPRTYLTPAVVREIDALIRASGDVDDEYEKLVRIPVGNPDVPPHETMTLEQWTSLADGAFLLEEAVEVSIAQPLLRMLLADRTGVTTQRQFPVGRRRADWAILEGDRPVAVVETKLGISSPGPGGWASSAEFAQVRDYVDRLDVPGLLVDVKQVMLVGPGATEPHVILDRRQFTPEHLETVRKHLGLGG